VSGLPPLRVLHIAPSFARRDGGPSEVLRGLLPALEALDVRVSVVATDKGVDESDADFSAAHDVRVAAARFPLSWSYAPGVRRLIRDAMRYADVVHVHSIHTHTTTVALEEGIRSGVPVVLEPHGALDLYHLGQGGLKKRLYSRLIDRRGLRNLAGAIYSSPKELTEGSEFLRGVKSYEMPLGVDAALFSATRQPSESPTVLFLGRVTEKKHLNYLLEAMASSKVRALNPQLIVAGPIDSGLQYSPSALVESLGLSANVTFLGQVTPSERLTLLARANAFVLASDDESFGMAAAEALAAGCPTIVTPEVGIAVAAAEVGALYLCASGAEDLDEVLSRVLANREDAEATGRRGRAYAVQSFTWSAVAAAAVQIYEDVRADH